MPHLRMGMRRAGPSPSIPRGTMSWTFASEACCFAAQGSGEPNGKLHGNGDYVVVYGDQLSVVSDTSGSDFCTDYVI